MSFFFLEQHRRQWKFRWLANFTRKKDLIIGRACCVVKLSVRNYRCETVLFVDKGTVVTTNKGSSPLWLSKMRNFIHVGFWKYPLFDENSFLKLFYDTDAGPNNESEKTKKNGYFTSFTKNNVIRNF